MLLLLLAACSEANLVTKGPNDAGDGTADTGTSGEADSAADSGAMDSGKVLPPARYTIEATLTVLKGAPVVDAAAVSLLVVADDDLTVLCDLALDVTSLTAAKPPDDSIGAWWTMDVHPKTRACAELPEHLELGLGALTPDVRAQIGATDLYAVADSLYGAYVSEDGTSVYSFGWAGTDADAAGDDLAALPIPDGVYSLVPTYLLALPPQE